MEPFIELALERWAREYNNKYDQQQIAFKRNHLRETHPHLFRGNPLKPTNKQIDARISATEEGGTAEVLERRAAEKAKASNEESSEEYELANSWDQWLKDNQHIPGAALLLKRTVELALLRRSRNANA
jgi:hypothetical protein